MAVVVVSLTMLVADSPFVIEGMVAVALMTLVVGASCANIAALCGLH